MTKEGEGGVKRKKISSLQGATGQGKETEGIRYPYPAPYVLAFIEDEFGSLDEMMGAPTKHAYHFSLMLVAFLEMQRQGKLENVVGLSREEREKACHKLLKEKKISTTDILGAHGKAAMEVFSKALGIKLAR